MLKAREANNYKENSRLFKPKKRIVKHAVCAFIAGGAISLFGQLIFDILHRFFELHAQVATSYMVVILIGLSSIATGLGLYKKGAQLFGAGMIVPITGFANAMTATALEYRSEGFVNGIGANLFRLVGPILITGISAAYLISFSRLFIHMLLR